VIEAPGVVEHVQGDVARVRLTEVQGGCGRCHEPGGCGGARIAHAFGQPNSVFHIPFDEPLKVGQAVVLMADEKAALGAALATYALPTMLVLLGVAIGASIWGDAGALVGFVASLILSVLAVRMLLDRRGWSRRLTVRMRPVGSCAHTA